MRVIHRRGWDRVVRGRRSIRPFLVQLGICLLLGWYGRLGTVLSFGKLSYEMAFMGLEYPSIYNFGVFRAV